MRLTNSSNVLSPFANKVRRSRFCGLIFALLIAGLLTFPLLAQDPPEQDKPEQPEQDIAAPVVLDGKPVFEVSATFQGATIQERAANISARLKKLADDTSVAVDDVRIVETENSVDLVYGDTVIFAAIDPDAEAAEKTKRSVAEENLVNIKNAVSAYRVKYGWQSALTGVGLALVTIGVFIVLLILIKKNFPKLRDWVEDQAAGFIGSTKWRVLTLIDVNQVKVTIGFLMNLIRLAALVALLFVTVQLVLGFLPWTRNLANELLTLLIGPLRTLGAALISEIPNLIFIIVVIVLAFYAIKILRAFFTAIHRETITFKSFAPEWAMFTFRLVKIGVVILALIVCFPYIPGSDSEAFRAIGIFLGVLVSFGSTSIVANAVGGITLNYLRTFNIGDRVKIGDYTGDIVRWTLQVTHLRTIKNEEIMVPNSMVVGSQIVNYSTYAKNNGLILNTKVTIGYDTPWRQVHAMLIMAAEQTEGVLSEPKPFILQTALNDFYAEYQLNAYTNEPKKMAKMYSDLHENIQDVFNEYGVQIMSPNYIDDRAEPTFVPKEKWFEPPAKKPEKHEDDG
ncbi:MAG: mechanosensitive ion channel family protein [Acidobacteria bacterium]|nr:MAG: mechanosensitive ion channel family protein [Acidobacteriota bacterium]REJ98659.1 MAG: mechanosensitive ion channel family protein [Acidobacteriota bacterium]REK16685.1 MAG: mechanosensitive ion channel family protein [Acidobacteriota bacterium]REK42596.1 MAG: mechanosensitive ion channel family protein [Acidobacteriota bacterium]